MRIRGGSVDAAAPAILTPGSFQRAEAGPIQFDGSEEDR
jgi:hypothetical protein